MHNVVNFGNPINNGDRESACQLGFCSGCATSCVRVADSKGRSLMSHVPAWDLLAGLPAYQVVVELPRQMPQGGDLP